MKKELKDYLHLYLGCEVQWTTVPSEVGTLVGVSKSEVKPDETIAIIGGAVFQEWYAEEVKLILRPLSGRTDEEKDWLEEHDMFYDESLSDETEPEIMMEWSADQTLYLLSRHFDLFGLHEAGLCLYKEDFDKIVPYARNKNTK